MLETLRWFFFSQFYVFHLIKPGASTELSCFNRSGKIDLTDRCRQGSRGVQWPFPALFLREAAEAPLSAPRTGAGAAFSPRQGRVASWGSGHQDLGGRAGAAPCDDMWQSLYRIPCAWQQIFASVATFVAFIPVKGIGFTEGCWIYGFQVKAEVCVPPGQPENKQTGAFPLSRAF